MAYGMENIANMLARGGMMAGQQIGAPIAQFGQNIGGMLTSGVQKQQKQTDAAEVQKLLEQNKDNPEQLTALYQKYASEGKTDLANLFKQAADAATQKRTAQVTSLEQGGAEITAQAQKSRAVQMALQRGDREAAQAIRSGLMDPKEYVAKIAGPQEAPKPVSLSPGGALVSPTGEVLYERPFKPEAPPAPKEPKVNFQKRDDGSILVFEGSELVQTIPAPETGTNQDAAMEVISKSVFLQSQVDNLMADVPTTGSGFLGGTVGQIPGTSGYDRDRDIINLKANLGFDQINTMKEQAAAAGASGTGLGQISNIEFMSLQSTVDALDIGMSGEAQLEALSNIKRYLQNVQKLASGVAPVDAVEWDRPEYKTAGYHKDPETGKVFYAPEGRSGTVYELINGKFVRMRSF